MDLLLGLKKELQKLEEIPQLEQKVRDLESQKLKKDEEILQLNGNFSNLNEGHDMIVKTYKQEMECLHKSIEDLKNQKQEKDQTISGLGKEINNIKNSTLEKDKIVGALEEEVKCLSGKTQQFEEEVEVLKNQKLGKDNTIFDLDKEIKELKTAMFEKNRVIGALEEKVKCLDGKRGQLEEEVEDLKDKNLKKETIISGLEKKQTKQQSELLDNDLLLVTLEEELELSEGNVIKLGEEIKVSKGQNIVKEKLVFECNEELSNIKAELMDTNQSLVTYEEKLNDFKGKVGLLEQENQHLNGHKLRADRMIKEMESEHFKANDLIHELEKKLLEKDKAVELCKEQLCGLERTVKQLESTIQDLESGTLTAERMISEMKSEHSKVNDENVKVILKLNGEIVKLKYDAVEKNQDVAAWEEKVRKLDFEVQGLKEKKLKAGRRIQEMECKQRAADQTISEMQREKSKANHEREKIITELEEKIGKLDKLLQEKAGKLEKDVQDLKDKKLAVELVIEKMKREHTRVGDERNKTVSTLKNQVQNRDRIVGMGQKKIGQLEVNIQDLKREKFEADRRIEKMERDQSKINHEREKTIAELDGKILKLEKQILENVQVVGMYTNKLELSDANMKQLEEDNQCLKDQIESAQETIEKMKCKEFSTGQEIEKMKGEKLEAEKIIQKLKDEVKDLRCRMSVISKAVAGKQSLVDQNVEFSASTYTKRGSSDFQKKGSGGNAENPYQVGESECKRLKGDSDSFTSQKVSPKIIVEKRVPSASSLTDSDSDDEDSSSSPDNQPEIINTLANIRCIKYCKVWGSVDEMRKQLQDDIEFCMYVVCVLYRHNISHPGELSRFDALRGGELAEYLINGDSQNRLLKFPTEVSEERPDELVKCRQLARDHCDMLYFIFCNGEDPFFKCNQL